MQVDNNFIQKILFSDEAKFSNNGSVNKHNCHHYAQENPIPYFYNQQWIGRGTLNAWPPRSPDMTPLNFFYGVLLRSKYTRHPFTPSKSYKNA
ncbi:unnamed protein product [Tenebrio molitor]|nr:unnamed protein product [Tenebrio molitor]